MSDTRKNKFLRLEAVVEISTYKEDLPKWNYPDFEILDQIRLWKGISFDEISLVIAQIAGYSDSFDLSQSKKNILKQIIAFRKDEDNGLIVSGGVNIRSESKVFRHGCCSGLETWREVIEGIENKESPWMGHDPDPHIEFHDGFIRFWQDKISIYSNQSELDQYHIDIPNSRLKDLIQRLEEDMQDFFHLLGQWVNNIDPHLTEDFLECFDFYFNVKHCYKK